MANNLKRKAFNYSKSLVTKIYFSNEIYFFVYHIDKILRAITSIDCKVQKKTVSINILKHQRFVLDDLNRKRNLLEDYYVASKVTKKAEKPSSVMGKNKRTKQQTQSQIKSQEKACLVKLLPTPQAQRPSLHSWYSCCGLQCNSPVPPLLCHQAPHSKSKVGPSD